VSQNNYQVNVTGQGKVLLDPDTAEVTLGVSIDNASTANVAIQELNTTIGKIIPALESLGIPKKDIRTLAYNLYPKQSFVTETGEPSTISGYNADQMVIVSIKDLSVGKDLVNKTVAKATEAGANQIKGVAFTSSKLSDLKQRARLLAIQDAKKQSQETAKTAGVKLGKITGWYENLIQSPDLNNVAYSGMAVDGGVGTPQITPGKEEIIIDVNISYEVK
jgi:uncharacterized protein YggE